MTKKRKTCAVCGKEFDAKSPNTKYCSAICKERGNYLRRKEWEERTGFYEKQRENMKLYRERLAEEKAALQAEAKKKAKQLPKLDKKTQRLKAQLDATAIGLEFTDAMECYGNTCPEYWEAFKNMTLAYAEAWDRECTTEVNGISVYREDFALAASMSVEELGRAEVRSGTKKRGNK